MFDSQEQQIVRCFCCGNWVRLHATKVEKTGPRGDDELWCVGCIDSVNEFTDGLNRSAIENNMILELEEGE